MTAARRALLTGVTGQDGWYLSRLLLDAGYQVFGLVHADDTAAIPAGVAVVAGDLRDSESIRAAVDVARPDEIYNLGGVSSVGLSWQQPVLTAEVTGLGLLRLIDAIRVVRGDANAVRLVQASSAEIFGDAPAPQSEATRLAPLTPYGAAKAFAHHAAGLYRSAGMSISTAVLYNHESPRRPETFVSRLITRQVALIARGQAERLMIGSLDSRRDWGHAADYARALYLIGRHPTPGDFVIASGTSRTVGDFVQAAFARVAILDWQERVDLDPSFTREADVIEQRGNPDKAHNELGWWPEVSFEQMVGEMVDADLAVVDAAHSAR